MVLKSIIPFVEDTLVTSIIQSVTLFANDINTLTCTLRFKYFGWKHQKRADIFNYNKILATFSKSV